VPVVVVVVVVRSAFEIARARAPRR